MKTFAPVWYTIPLFLQSHPVSVFHKEQEEPKETAMGVKNLHVLARAEYTAKKGTRARLRISADDHYKLYINGDFAAQGPAPGYPEHSYYNELDITEYLNEGKNVLAVHLYYQGLINRVWNSGDNRFGVGARIGSYSSDEETESWEEPCWRYCITEAYSGGVIGYDTQFLENFDGRLWEDDWNQKEFDDSSWEKMVPAPWADYHFEEEAAVLLEVSRCDPETVIRREDGSWFIDMGSEVAGSLCVTALGTEGASVIVRCGEELTGEGNVRYEMRCNCTYEEMWTLGEGVHTLEPYDYKAFRYAELRPQNGARIQKVYAALRHYPFDESLSDFQCGDKRLERIFALCKNTIRHGVQEGFLDCPSREKGQYLGDAIVSAHAHAWLSGSTALLRKCIRQFVWTDVICPGLMGVAPGSMMQEISEFSLLWPELLLTDYRFTGDREFLRECYPAVKAMLRHFSQYARADGLLEQVADKWNMVDWPENLRDDYDFCLSRPVVAPGCHNVINALYIGSVKMLCEIEEILGYAPSADWRSLKEAYVEAFYRRDKRLFADSETSSHCAMHSNVYALYFGLEPEGAAEHICDFLVQKGFACGVWTSYFVLRALAGRGRYEEVYHLLVNESEHGWMNMLREGATTCFEAWGKEQKWNTSLCHPWACAPLIVVIEELAGITLRPESEAGYEVKSHFPKEAGKFYLKVPFRGSIIRQRG